MGRKKNCDNLAIKFQNYWNKSSNTKEVAEKMEMTILEVKRMAYSLRRRKIILNNFKTTPYKLANKTIDPTPEEIKIRAEQIRETWKKKIKPVDDKC